MSDDRRDKFKATMLDSERRDLMEALRESHEPKCSMPTCDDEYEGLYPSEGWFLFPVIITALCPQHAVADHRPLARWVQAGETYIQRVTCSCGEKLGDHTGLYGARDAFVTHLEVMYNDDGT